MRQSGIFLALCIQRLGGSAWIFRKIRCASDCSFGYKELQDCYAQTRPVLQVFAHLLTQDLRLRADSKNDHGNVVRTAALERHPDQPRAGFHRRVLLTDLGEVPVAHQAPESV